VNTAWRTVIAEILGRNVLSFLLLETTIAVIATITVDCEQSLYLLFPGLRLNARENGKKGRRREEK
jgi:hypothetical protein